MLKVFSFLSALFVWVAFGQEELTPANFDDVVDGSKNVFVMFYAPWCGHCKKFKPEYADVARSFKGVDDVVIASVDADAHKALGGRYGVSGFPTLKFFEKGSTDASDFDGKRSADGVIKFVNEKAGTDVKLVEAPSLVTVLDESNFDSIALDTNKDVLVEFYAPWCGHCKKLKPTYEKLAEAFENEKDVVIAKVDATEAKDLASKYEVRGYPTLKWFGKGTEEAEDYTEGRSVDAFVKFINENAGTRRNPDGTLALSAGRVPDLDALAKTFFTDASQRDAIKTELETKCASDDFTEDECKYYLKFSSKIAEKGNEYVENEIARLKKLSKSESVTKEKRDNMLIRMNVLRGFLEGSELELNAQQEAAEAAAKAEL